MVGKKLKKVRKNGEDNVPGGRPTQNYYYYYYLLCGLPFHFGESTY